MKAPQIADRINADVRNAQQTVVRGTPTVFIDGVVLRDKSIRGFEQVIQKELRRHKNTDNQ